MATFSYTQIADYILDQLWGYASANNLKNSVRYLAEDILGDPSANSDKVNATAWTAASANAARAATTRATGTTVAAGGVGISGSSGTFTTSSSSYVDVTNLSVTITTNGRPVRIFLAPINDASAGQSYIGATKLNTDGNIGIAIQILRGATVLCAFRTEIGFVTTASTEPFIRVPPSAVEYIDPVAAGTYTYKLQTRILAGNEEFAEVIRCQLVAYEL